MAKNPRSNTGYFVENLFARSILGAALLLPYAPRVRLVGWIMSRLVAPFAGWNKRVADNLALTMPKLSQADVKRITKRVTNNVGRTLIEIYSGEEFIDRIQSSPIVGPGVAALEANRGKAAVLVTAHMGNYDAVRGKLSRVGYPMGALYRPMKNPVFHKHYLEAISKIATPVFPTDGRGIAGLIKLLKDGGNIGIVADVASTRAPVLRFFDQPAHTPLSAAEWALKYNAAMIPVFGLREDDGLSFHLHVANPIPHSTAEEMMQRYNDEVEAIVRRYPDQWFWVHKRWKLGANVSGATSDATRPG